MFFVCLFVCLIVFEGFEGMSTCFGNGETDRQTDRVSVVVMTHD